MTMTVPSSLAPSPRTAAAQASRGAQPEPRFIASVDGIGQTRYIPSGQPITRKRIDAKRAEPPDPRGGLLDG